MREHSLAGAQSKLPHPLTSFIGREIELTELQRLLQERRLVTLIGAGGSGKTRLALEAVPLLARLFPEGIFFVELAPLSQPELVTETVAHTLGVEADGEMDLPDAVVAFFLTGQALLILDNCEHLLEECAGSGEQAAWRLPGNSYPRHQPRTPGDRWRMPLQSAAALPAQSLRSGGPG